MRRDPTISKTIRFPQSIYDYVDAAPGETFTDKLLGLLELQISRKEQANDYID